MDNTSKMNELQIRYVETAQKTSAGAYLLKALEVGSPDALFPLNGATILHIYLQGLADKKYTDISIEDILIKKPNPFIKASYSQKTPLEYADLMRTEASSKTLLTTAFNRLKKYEKSYLSSRDAGSQQIESSLQEIVKKFDALFSNLPQEARVPMNQKQEKLIEKAIDEKCDIYLFKALDAGDPNAQDENGNTIAHLLVSLASNYDWDYRNYEGNIFNRPDINPFIKNNSGKRADELFFSTLLRGECKYSTYYPAYFTHVTYLLTKRTLAYFNKKLNELALQNKLLMQTNQEIVKMLQEVSRKNDELNTTIKNVMTSQATTIVFHQPSQVGNKTFQDQHQR